MQYETPASEQWRNDDERHCCAFCEHCAVDRLNGYTCSELATFLKDNAMPARTVILNGTDGICDHYSCDREVFLAEHGEYPSEGGSFIDLYEENGVDRRMFV